MVRLNVACALMGLLFVTGDLNKSASTISADSSHPDGLKSPQEAASSHPQVTSSHFSSNNGTSDIDYLLKKEYSKELTCSNKVFLQTFMTSEHPGSHVFEQTRNIFIRIQDII
ncbi:hypothetical protein DPMN_055721 [Dreissena polymorpha]|uniref:Uncharacterized protein n=1 Tax=Dreissena polymorpha TaxID=45954 RepID=A0A9D4CSY0_DREPO|nr:hypothetical protein DPMN_055721 [Dreissena polymorpha]